MYRAGDRDAYQAHEVTKEQEAAWVQEMIDQQAEALSIMNADALVELKSIAAQHPLPSILERVLLFASRQVSSADSVIKLLYAETLLAFIKQFKRMAEPALRQQAFKVTLSLLEEVMTKPLILDPGHDLQHFKLKDKKALNERARRGLDELRSLWANE